MDNTDLGPPHIISLRLKLPAQAEQTVPLGTIAAENPETVKKLAMLLLRQAKAELEVRAPNGSVTGIPHRFRKGR